MSRDLTVVIVLLLLISPLHLLTQAPATQPANDPETLIAQLSADDWKARQQAQERLIEMGQPVVERLKRLIRETQDEEMRSRAETALRQIEANDRSGPTLVTLHMNNTPLSTVTRELAKQAKTEITLWPPFDHQWESAKVSINAERQPFWLVMRELCEQASLTPNRTVGAEYAITLVRHDRSTWARKPFVMHEGFLITAEEANRSHNIDYAAQDIANSFSIQFRILADPKLRVIQRPRQIKLEEVLDEKGNSLALPSPNNWGPNVPEPWSAGWLCDVSATLKYQPDIGRRIASFKGSASFVTMSKSDTWQIPDVLNAKDVQHAMPLGKYTLHEVRQTQGGQYRATILIDLTAGPVPPQNPLVSLGTLQQCIRLVDANGRGYAMGGGGGGSINAKRLSYLIHFHPNDVIAPKLDPPAKLIWDVPVELKEILVPIQFKDLPIP
ncbi:MAG: HEAT repeat domain-containing protein [Bacillota bacterium]